MGHRFIVIDKFRAGRVRYLKRTYFIVLAVFNSQLETKLHHSGMGTCGTNGIGLPRSVPVGRHVGGNPSHHGGSGAGMALGAGIAVIAG